jgi:hypothetical protein
LEVDGMGFWVRSDDGVDLLYTNRLNIRKADCGWGIFSYEPNYGWVKVATFTTEAHAHAQLDNVQSTIHRNCDYVYSMSEEKIKLGKS